MAAGKKKKKKFVKWIVLVIILILIVLGISQCSKSGDQVQTVEVTAVKKGDVAATLDTSGTIASEDTKTYVSPVTGTLEAVNAKAGQEVKTGDYLVTYDTASLEASYTQADLQAKSSSASTADTIAKSNESAKEAANQGTTISSLNTQIAAAQTDVNNATAALKQNQSDLASVEAQIADYQQKIKNASADSSETNSEDTDSEKTNSEKTKTTDSATELADWQAAVEELTKQQTVLSASTASLQEDLESKTATLTSLQSDLAEAKAKKESAESLVMSDSAKASLNYSSQATSLTVTDAEDNLKKAQAGVVAEFDGIVTSVDAISGTTAAEGQTLVTVADSGNMKVDFQVSKYELEEVSVGQKVTITTLDHTYSGTISSISKMATIDTAGATSGSTAAKVAAEVHIDKPDSNLILGMEAKLAVALGEAKDALVVPVAAVNTDTDGDFVYIVKDNVVKRQAVTTGLYGKEQVEITDGLKEGDHVISVVDSSIEEGMTVVENLVED